MLYARDGFATRCSRMQGNKPCVSNTMIQEEVSYVEGNL